MFVNGSHIPIEVYHIVSSTKNNIKINENNPYNLNEALVASIPDVQYYEQEDNEYDLRLEDVHFGVDINRSLTASPVSKNKDNNDHNCLTNDYSTIF